MYISTFPYFGGKFRFLKWLLPLLPQTQAFVDAFGGSGCVILNKEPTDHDIFNDIDGDVVNFYRQLREHPDELILGIHQTLYARGELEIALQPTDDPIEAARRFYVRMNQSILGKKARTVGDWMRSINYSRRQMPKPVSQWLGKLPNLPAIHARFSTVLVEHRDALRLIPEFDGKHVLIYCDPPYLHLTRQTTDDYEFEFVNEQHRELVDVARGCEGKIAISAYNSPEIREMYRGFNLYRGPIVNISSKIRTGGRRQEWLITNYRPTEVT